MPEVTSIFQNFFKKTVAIPFSCLIFQEPDNTDLTNVDMDWFDEQVQDQPVPKDIGKDLNIIFQF